MRPNERLSEDDVRAIRRAVRKGIMRPKEAARKWGRATDTIRRIVRGEMYEWVKDEEELEVEAEGSLERLLGGTGNDDRG